MAIKPQVTADDLIKDARSATGDERFAKMQVAISALKDEALLQRDQQMGATRSSQAESAPAASAQQSEMPRMATPEAIMIDIFESQPQDPVSAQTGVSTLNGTAPQNFETLRPDQNVMDGDFMSTEFDGEYAATNLEELGPEWLDLPSKADGSNENSPLQESPVTVGDRLKLAFGNEAGRLQFLKDNYGEAKVNADGDMVVKIGDTWQSVDPDGLGDSKGWSFAEKISKKGEEALKDFVDLADDAVSIISTGAGASLATAPGAVVAGAAASLANSSLGRWAGTYEATPEEQLADAAIESLFIGGGYMILPAGKIAGKMASNQGRKLLQKLGVDKVDVLPKLTDSMGAFGKSVKTTGARVTESLLRLGGAKPGSASTIVKHADKMMPMVNTAQRRLSKGETLAAITSDLDNQALNTVQKAFSSFKTQAAAQIDNIDDKIVGPAMRNVSIDPKAFVRDVVTDTGETISQGPLAKQLSGLINITASKSRKGLNKISFSMKPTSEIDPLLLAELGPNGNAIVNTFGRQVLPMLNKLQQQKRIGGDALVKEMKGFTSAMSEIISSSQGRTKEVARNLETYVMKNIERQVAGSNQAAWNTWVEREGFRRRIFQPLNEAGKRVFGASPTQAATLNQLTADPLNTSGMSILMGNLEQAVVSHPSLAQSGRKVFAKQLQDLELARMQAATKDFLTWMPKKLSSTQLLLSAGFAAQDIATDGAPGAVSGLSAVGLALTSPRIQAGLVRNMMRFGRASSGSPAMVQQAAQTLRSIKPMLLTASPAQRGQAIQSALAMSAAAIGGNQ